MAVTTFLAITLTAIMPGSQNFVSQVTDLANEKRMNIQADVPTIHASSTPQAVAEYIVWRASALGIDKHNTDLALSIAYAESRFQCVPNKNGPRYGICIFQITATTWLDTCLDMRSPPWKRSALVPVGSDVWNPEANVECALQLIKLKQFNHWAPYSVDTWKTLPFKVEMIDNFDWK